jgi:DNA modification methylase
MALLLSDVKPYAKNAKLHPPKQLKQIAQSIKRWGWQQPIKLGRDNTIIVGHGRWYSWQKHGEKMKLNDPWIIDENGKTIYGEPEPKKLTAKEEKAYRLADNKLNESKWEMPLVIDELQEIGDYNLISLTGFSHDLLNDNDSKDDEVPDLPKTSHIKKGDVFQLGEHRLVCGDATEEGDILKLLDGNKAQMTFTDPPYNVDYTGGSGLTKDEQREGILNDDMSKSEFLLFLEKAMRNINQNTQGGIYVCMSSSELETLKRAFENAGGHWSTYIVWIKNNFTMGRGDYQQTYEPILYGWNKQIKNHYFIDDRDAPNAWEEFKGMSAKFENGFTTVTFQGFKIRIEGKVENAQVMRKRQRTNIWRYDKPTKSEMHPTTKPVALCAEAITNSSMAGHAVLDPFAGSGSTLIACEKLGRVCYAMELDPLYCEVIIKRWEEYTDQKAERVED